MSEDNKKKFEVRIERTSDKFLQKNIYVDNELFPFEIDEESLKWAQSQGPQFFEATKRDIEKFFLESLSEFVGKRISGQDFQQALKTGMI